MPSLMPEDYEDFQNLLAQQMVGMPYGVQSVSMSAPSNDPKEKELRALLQQKMMESMQNQQKNIGDAKKSLMEEASKPKQVDLSPGWALVDVMGGSSKGAAMIPQPEDQDAKVRQLRQDVVKQQGALTDDQINYLKSRLNDARTSYMQNRLAQGADRMDRNEHMKIVAGLNNNKPLVDRAAQYQNLQNALALVTKPKNLTPQQIHEFQQAVRKNLGINGSSGVGERESTYFDSLGLRGENWMQLLSGNPAEISKDSKLMQHLRDLANTEMANVQSQYADNLDAVSEGRYSMYQRRPDLKGDLDRKILAMGKRVGVGQGPAETASNTLQKSGGVIQPINGAGFGNTATAAEITPKDTAALQWAQDPANKNNPALPGIVDKLRKKGLIK